MRAETTPEFETVVVAMRSGQICPTPVCTRYGVHVLRLDRRIEGETLPFGAVRVRIATSPKERTWRRAVAHYVALVAGQARFAGFALSAATPRLVQQEAAMLGHILGALTNPVFAEEALAAVGNPGVVARVRQDAATKGLGVGTLVACTARHSLDHAGARRMAGSSRPYVRLTALRRRRIGSHAGPSLSAAGSRRHRAASVVNAIAFAVGSRAEGASVDVALA